jgi:hypothetical protein
MNASNNKLSVDLCGGLGARMLGRGCLVAPAGPLGGER